MIDLHTHSTLSDGELIPAELVRRARVAGYRAMAITDHADAATMEHILSVLPKLTRLDHYFDMDVLCGVELTHVPPALIADHVKRARKLGAQIVVVHGETVVEPVARGTNLAAIEAGVDVLAHPGLITEQEVKLAAEVGVALEITTRGGHNYTNGHVAALARKHGARLVIDNDAHAPRDLVGLELRMAAALGAGLTPEEVERAEKNAFEIVQRARQS
jgi:histidinol phosphatase-like PHP family hydrolase